MLPIVNRGHLPQDVEDALLKSLVRVKASSCSDANLHRGIEITPNVSSVQPRHFVGIQQETEKQTFGDNHRVTGMRAIFHFQTEWMNRLRQTLLHIELQCAAVR